MKVGDLVFDSSLGQRGIIVETKKWSTEEVTVLMQTEHTILYEDGQFDHAYENELEVINESR